MSHHLRRIGVFIDVQNIYLTMRAVFQQPKINYRVLRDYLVNGDDTSVTISAFTCFDPELKPQMEFLNALSLMGYRVVSKPIKWLPDGTVKANMDLEMALEVLTQSQFLDEVVLVTGDGDFVALLNQLALMGKIVRVIGPDRATAPELIQSCHEFMSLSQIEHIMELD